MTNPVLSCSRPINSGVQSQGAGSGNVRIQTTPIPVMLSTTTTTTTTTTAAPLSLEETSPLAALLNGNSVQHSASEADNSLESRSDEEALLEEEEEHEDDEENDGDDEDESEGRSQQDEELEAIEEHQQQEAHAAIQQQHQQAQHDIPVEQKLKQITREIEEMSHSDRDVDNGRQSFLSLSDLIKNIRPAEKVVPQIDSSYANTMRVLGETITHGESRSAKI